MLTEHLHQPLCLHGLVDFLSSGYDSNSGPGFYKNQIKLETDKDGTRDQPEWYKSPVYPIYENGPELGDEQSKTRWRFSPNPTWAQALNLMNRRHMYFGDNGNQKPISINN